jgi:hypothetical protein
MNDKLQFDDIEPLQKMAPDAVVSGCVLLMARLPNEKQVQFVLTPKILTNVLHAKSAAGEAAVDYCRKNRDRIEAASRKAYAERPSPSIELEADDFRHVGE